MLPLGGTDNQQGKTDNMTTGKQIVAEIGLLLYPAANVDLIALPMNDNPQSPCTGVCRMDHHTDLCTGCLRTLDEIAAWGRLSVASRRDVIERLRSRARMPGAG